MISCGIVGVITVLVSVEVNGSGFEPIRGVCGGRDDGNSPLLIVRRPCCRTARPAAAVEGEEEKARD